MDDAASSRQMIIFFPPIVLQFQLNFNAFSGSLNICSVVCCYADFVRQSSSRIHTINLYYYFFSFFFISLLCDNYFGATKGEPFFISKNKAKYTFVVQMPHKYRSKSEAFDWAADIVLVVAPVDTIPHGIRGIANFFSILLQLGSLWIQYAHLMHKA